MSSRNNSSGFTLIEVLVAIVILATGLVLIVQGMARTQQALKISQNLIQASQIAEEQLTVSEIELFEKRKLSTSQDSGVERIPGAEMTWTRRVEAYAAEEIEDQSQMNQTSVSVKWKEGSRGESVSSLTALFLNRPKQEKTSP